jgi:hypothetical protein
VSSHLPSVCIAVLLPMISENLVGLYFSSIMLGVN